MTGKIEDPQIIQLCTRTISHCPHHWQDAITIVHVLEGTIKVNVWAKEYELAKGHLIIFNVGEIYAMQGLSQESKIQMISINKSLLQAYSENWDVVYILCNSTVYEQYQYKEYQLLRAYIKDISYRIMENQRGKELKESIGGLLEHLIEQFDLIRRGSNFTFYSDKIVERYRWIFRQVKKSQSNTEKVSLKSLAAELNLSYKHLRKDILDRYGQGYMWFRYTLMVHRASKMMMTSDIPITEISYLCGFSDPKYLIKYFKIYYHCTPSQFRRNIKNNQDLKKCCIDHGTYRLDFKDLYSSQMEDGML